MAEQGNYERYKDRRIETQLTKRKQQSDFDHLLSCTQKSKRELARELIAAGMKTFPFSTWLAQRDTK